MRRSTGSTIAKGSHALVVLALFAALTSGALAVPIEARDSTSDEVTPTATMDLVNPWAAGDAAARNHFAELGRERYLACKVGLLRPRT